MPRPRTLALIWIASLAVAYGFAFTLIGLAAELLGVLALVALAAHGVRRIVHRPAQTS
jgi:membrane protein implicated in regulation of membrane protease activity